MNAALFVATAPASLLALVLLLPGLLLVAIPFLPAPSRALLLPLAAAPALAAALLLPDGAELVAPLLPTGLTFGMDALTRAFLLPAALIWLFAGWMARQLHPNLSASPVFGVLWLCALAGNLMLILAQDLLALYTGIALMTFAALGWVVIERTPQALAAGRIYLAMMLVAELALFIAVAALVAGAGGDTRFEALPAVLSGPIAALLALAFGLKLGVLGLHGWLPRAHPVAPVAASAVLSGVMIKAGMLGWLRVVEPAGEGFAPTFAGLLVALGFSGALYAVLRGLMVRDPKVLLAWSSVSQMGLLTVFAGLVLLPGAAAGAAVAGILLFVVHHGLAKAALFLGVGLLGALQGRRRFRVWVLLWLPALALAAAPGTSGVFVKAALDLALADAGADGVLNGLVVISSVASALLMLRFLALTRRLPVANPTQTPAGLWAPEWPWLLLLGGMLGLPWLMFQDAPFFQAAASQAEQWAALLPWLAALLLLALASYGPIRGWMRRAAAWRLAWLRARPLDVLWPTRFPGVFRLANWERRLHAWSLIGRAVVLVTLALVAAIGYGQFL